MHMKKTVFFLVGLSLTLTFLTATPAKAGHWSFGFYWPGFTVGVGAPPAYYYPAPPPIYYYPPPYYYGGYYGRYPRGYYGGYPRRYYGGYPRRYYGGGYQGEIPDRGYQGEGNYDGGYQGEGNYDGGYQGETPDRGYQR